MKKTYACSVLCLVTLFSCLLTAQVTVPVYQYDNSHSGTNTNETILTPSNVNVSQFGRVNGFSCHRLRLRAALVCAQPDYRRYLPQCAVRGHRA